MLYGTEVDDISDKSIGLIENTHWAVARTIQGLSRTAPNPTVLPSLGWMSIGSIIDKMRMDFLLSILNLEPDNIYRRVALVRILQYKLAHTTVHDGPVMRALKVLFRYKLLDTIYVSLDTGEFMPMSRWKKLTDKNVCFCEKKVNPLFS